MADTLAPLILDFLEWIAAAPRPYSEVMAAWRTSCPKLTVWEDAVEQNLVAVNREGPEILVELAPQGRALLERSGR